MRNFESFRLRRIFVMALVATFTLVACTGDDSTAESVTEPDQVSETSDSGGESSPSTNFVARADHSAIASPEVVFVAAEGQWLCDVQSRAFTNLDDLEQARTVTLSNFGITALAYDDFKLRLGADPTLRDHVLTEFEAVCTG